MKTIEIDQSGRLVGTRFTVYHIVPLLLEGLQPPAMQEVYEQLSIDEIHAMLQHIEEHREEVMAGHRRIEERIARGNPPWVEEMLARSPHHARIQGRLEEIRRKRAQEANGDGHPG
jgi:uncharacterized protein (DUF433 family)